MILDEFQRFSDLLHGKDEASQLAQQLFRYRRAVRRVACCCSRRRRTACSPRRTSRAAMATTRISSRPSAFSRTIRSARRHFESALAAYGKELFRIGMDDGQALRRARDDVAGDAPARDGADGAAGGDGGSQRDAQGGDVPGRARDGTRHRLVSRAAGDSRGRSAFPT